MKIPVSLLFRFAHFFTKDNFYLSFLLVLLSNSVPLLGVLFLKWSIIKILYAYTMESIILILFGLPKILTAKLKFPKKKWEQNLGSSAFESTALLGIAMFAFLGAHVAFLLPLIHALLGGNGYDSYYAFFKTELLTIPIEQSLSFEILFLNSFLLNMILCIVSQGESLFLFFKTKEFLKFNHEHFVDQMVHRIGFAQGTLLFSLPILLFALWLFPKNLAPVLCSLWVLFKLFIDLFYLYNRFHKEKSQV